MRCREGNLDGSRDYSALVRAARRLPAAGAASLRVALLSDASTQHLAPLLRVLLSQRGFDCNTYEAPFDAIELEVHDNRSGLFEFSPDVVVILNAVQALRSRFHQRAGSTADFLDETTAKLTRIWKSISSRTHAIILQSTFVIPYERYFGNFDHKTSDSFSSVVSALNYRIVSQAKEFGAVFINDVDFVACWTGRKGWFDDRFWDLAKSFAALERLPYLASNIVNIICAHRGQVVKCIVLDLDNTLWGGVVGDDGVERIQLNAHGEGEGFHRLQLYLKELKQRGVLLAVCSKNDLANALAPFERHPEMVLKREDFACFIANWEDKAHNLQVIQETLNIGLESMVFLDDNPFERNLVRGLLPAVIVPELPEDPADYVRSIAELELFEVTNFSAEDQQRAELYRKEAVRKEQQSSFSTVEEFLQSLDMRMSVAPFDEYQLPRIAQLMQRSNQFNLTTCRRSEGECSALRDNSNYLTFSVTLADRFGDHGLISIVIAEIRGGELALTDWLMSCRVLKRGVEQAVMNHVFQCAGELGVREVSGEFHPTAKNGMVSDFFGQFGFTSVSQSGGITRWRRAVYSYRPYAVFITSTAPPVAEAATISG